MGLKSAKAAVASSREVGSTQRLALLLVLIVGQTPGYVTKASTGTALAGAGSGKLMTQPPGPESHSAAGVSTGPRATVTCGCGKMLRKPSWCEY